MKRCVLLALAAAFSIGVGSAEDRWIATWSASASPANPNMEQMERRGLVFDDQTVRLNVRITVGGSQFRIRLSNAFGKEAVLIDGVRLALRAESGQPVSFSGRPWARIPAGAIVLSDPIELEAADSADLAVSMYLPPKTGAASTVHYSALQSSHVSAGNVLGTAAMPESKTITSWPWLVGVDVLAPEKSATVVTLGDSITDGSRSTADANRRWPNVLAERLLGRRGRKVAVVNAGIGGNRILHDGAGAPGPQYGPSALARLDRDVLAQPGVEWVIVLEGVNDIGHPGGSAPMSEDVSAEDMIAGLKQIVDRCHERGVKVIGATILPFGQAQSPKEGKRLAVNEWIRTSGYFDEVVDFDEVIRRKDAPNRMREEFDGGDGLHPNDAGHKAMGEAVELGWFR